MAVGMSSYLAGKFLDSAFNATSFSVTTPYVKLHTGDPGASGTSNAAGNTTRKSVSFGAVSSGAIANDVAVSWSSGEVTTTEDYTHFSLWDASTSGNYLGSGTITANAVTAGDTFTIPVGDLDISLSIAS